MIGKREILDLSGALRLNPHIVEKDHALGWLLAGINAHPELTEQWVFKGGTCLKKCYFETYRFSEDLDFTLLEPAHLEDRFLKSVFAEIGEWIYERAGLEIPTSQQDFEVYENPRGKPSCRGRLSFRGAISSSAGGLQRIKLDLTADERLVLKPVRQPIFHPYSDAPDDGIEVLSYAYAEAFGEKVRALAERARPRDLYDVIHLYRNEEARPDAAELREVLSQKCDFKGIPIPRAGDIERHRDDLEAGWHSMLAHQLPDLPPVASFLDESGAFFDWLEGGEVAEAPAGYHLAAGETVIRERTLRLPVRDTARTSLEVIRFAAANRLCVDLDYKDSTRRIEPYSLRRTQADDVVLHAWDADKDAHRSYRVDRIQGARVSDQTFLPRYAIELTPTGPVTVQSASTRRVTDAGALDTIGTPRKQRRSTRSGPRRRSSGASTGPVYIYQCGMCGKKFRRKSQSSRLNKHKASGGHPCAGRMGVLVDIKY